MIKLTHILGNSINIDESSISLGVVTMVIFKNDKGCVLVVETPEEILKLIEGAKNAK